MAFSPLPRNYDEAIKEIGMWRAKYTREARDEIEAQRRQVAELKQLCDSHVSSIAPLKERAEKAEAQVAELKMLYQNEADNHNATMAENAALRELLGRAKWYVLDSVEYIEDEGDIEVAMELYGSIRGVVDAARGYAKNDAK